jgi:hypothetical protein
MRKSGDRSVIKKGDRRPVIKKHEHNHEHNHDGQKDDEVDVLLQEAKKFKSGHHCNHIPARAFESIDKLYKSNIKTIDHSLGGMYDYLKP